VTNDSFSQEATISGKVKYGGDVLQAATISFAGQTKLTNDNGEFYFSVKPGRYTIVITHAGYKKIEQPIIAEAGQTKNVDFEMIPTEDLREVRLGSRSKIQRSNLNTPVPVDVFSSGKLVETGQISLTQMLNFLAPSFNTSRELLNETSTLRGLDPQHVLILVNGIRKHPMAFIFAGNLRGQLGKGSVGNDLNSIPFPAIEKIEILRDGAAAQYGSDAIGGVIDIKLKKTVGKTTIQTHIGQYYQCDGDKFFLGINHGFSLNKKGYLNLSASYRNQAATLRGGTYEGLVYLNYPSNATPDDITRIKALDDLLVETNGFNRKDAIDNAGNTEYITKGFVANGGSPINDRLEIFWTVIANSRKLDRAGLFIFPKDSSRVNFALFPDGYQQRNKSNTVDISAITGLKGRTKNNWNWDLSSSYGVNSVRSHAINTNNASQSLILGANAPTSFYTGTDKFRQLTNDINFVRRYSDSSALLKNMSIGYGAEWRWENYISTTGEEASWKNYDTINYPQGGSGGSSPENAINRTRNVLGGYAELEIELDKHFLFNLAARYEYYSDFGGNIAGKLAARYKFSDKFMLRASVNNGFRAPSLQQRYFISIGEIPVTINGIRSGALAGIFPNDHEVIRALDIPFLTAEKSLNVSGGFTSTFLNHFNLSADAYWIQIRNRVVISRPFERRPGNKLDSILNRHPALNEISRISFFTNAINTITKGIDIILDGNWNNQHANFNISLAANFNSTRLVGTVKTSQTLAAIPQSSTTLFNSEEKTRLEKGQPGSKIILSMTYKVEKIRLNTRITRFGKTSIAPLSPARPEFFSQKILTDVSLTYSPKTWLAITAGANNIANIYPDRLKYTENTSQGIWIYSPEASPFGFNGGYYFVNFSLNF
jgi:iron complex outermembrane receptor protein